MASIKVLGSDSSGNCYLLQCKNETLIIELGVSWSEVKKALNYDLSSIVGCIATHRHLDHLKYAKNALNCGINVYSCQSVQNIHQEVKVLKKGIKTKIGEFYVQPISVPHSVECYAFIIEHKEIGKCLFLTDASDFTYKIKGLNHIFIEANYDEEILIDNACNNIINRSQSHNHLEINQTLNIVKNNYNASLVNILLLHLSSINSNEEHFINRIKEELCFSNVYVAKKGLELELEKEEF